MRKYGKGCELVCAPFESEGFEKAVKNYVLERW